METVPYVISADLHSAQLFRQTLQSLLIGSGILGNTDLAVIQHTAPNLSVNVEPGMIFIPGTQGSTTGQRANSSSQHAGYSTLPANFTTQGTYCAVNPAQVNLTLNEANATNPRIDLIVASVQDAQYSGSFNQALLQVVTGTPAGSPAAPTPPENTVVLAQVAVAAKATKIETAQITSKRVMAGTLSSLRAQYGTFTVAEFGGGAWSEEVPLPFAWPNSHALFLAGCAMSHSANEAWLSSGEVKNLTAGTVRGPSGPNFVKAFIPWVSLGN